LAKKLYSYLACLQYISFIAASISHMPPEQLMGRS
jgi:hypothetical protein